jgi:hypothetical protein
MPNDFFRKVTFKQAKKFFSFITLKRILILIFKLIDKIYIIVLIEILNFH